MNIAQILLLGLIILLGHTACHKDHEGLHDSETTFLVTSPLKKDTSITNQYVCQIHAIQHIELRALEEGYLQDIFVDEGQLVKKGQRMFQIMTTVYEAEVQKARAEAEFAKIEYQNTKALADSNIVSVNELALARADLDKSNAELALAEAHLEFSEMKAPFDGLINHLHVRSGSLLEQGELLTTLSDISQLWVYFNVSESEYLDYKTKVSKDSLIHVNLLMANNKLFDHPGKVTAIEADFNHETGNIAFRATFPNPDRLLRHGETGNILIHVPLNQALLIPQKATFEILDRKYVFVVDQDNKVRLRQITIGEELPHLYEVMNGLSENEKFLVEGLRKVRNEDKISYEYLEPDSVVSNLELYAE